METAAPPAGASPDKLTVHVVIPGVVRVEGEHVTEVRDDGEDVAANSREAFLEMPL